ncbi:invasin [Yersinia pekkanenii]|uniref:Invasin n=1 Tax=Yersinia pekkanenii TaxID=1288385 RepID=A0ABP1ZXV5_9GAMM|nr:invasin [Yersinia pekkanenii]
MAGAVANIVLNIVNDGAIANGSASNSVRALVSDGQGNPVSGQTVSFSSGNSSAQVTPVISTTGADGIATATLTNTLAGVSDVIAEIGAINDTINTHFVAGAVANIVLNIVNDGAIANGSATNSVRALVSDGQGNPVSGQTVSFSSGNSSAQVTPVISTTGADGIATATLTNTLAGVSDVIAEIGAINDTINTHFVAGAAANIVLNIVNDGAIANGSATNSVEALVSDARGNPVLGRTVSFTTSNNAQLTVVIGTTGADGIASATLTNTLAGTSSVKAEIGTINHTVDTLFVAGAAANIVLSIVDDGAIANGSATNSVKALVSDARGNPISGQTVSFSSANTTAQVTAVISITGADGIATATLTNTLAGVSNVIAELGAINKTINTHFVAGAAANIVLNIVNDGAIANGSASNSVRALVSDAQGNPISGQTVSFSSANTTAQVTPLTGATGVDGSVTVTLTNTKAGVSDVIAEIGAINEAINTHFVAGDAALMTLAITTNGAVADGTDSNEAQVVVTDAQGNPIDGAEVALSSATGVTITPATVTTDANGTATAALTHTVAGGHTITANIGLLSKTANAQFIADVTTAQIADGDLTIIANNRVADGLAANLVQAIVTDSHGNLLQGQVVEFAVDNNAVLQTSNGTTAADGRVFITLRSIHAGTTNVSATVASSGSQRDIDTLFIADTTTATLTATNLEIVADNARANGLDTNAVSARVTDANGNPVSGQTVAFTSSNSAVITLVNGVSDANGLTAITLTHTRSGASMVFAKLGNQPQQSKTTTFIADESTANIAASNMVITRNNAIANGINSNIVRVTVVDAYGNPVPDMAVSFSSVDGAAFTPPSGNTNSSGVIYTTVTNTVAGDSNVLAEITTSTGTHSQNKDVVFIADTSTARVSILEILKNDAVADNNDENRVRARIVDANDNPISDMAVNFSATNNVTLAAAVVTTDSDGYAANSITHNAVLSSTVTATVASDSTGQTAEVTFVAGQGARIAISRVTDDAVANGIDTNRVEAKVYDAADNLVPNAGVTFSAGLGTLVQADTTTNEFGVAYATVSHIKSGGLQVSVTADTLSGSTWSNFIADKDTATLVDGYLIITNNNALANGTAQNSVLLQVFDANNNPVAGVPVSFSSDNGASINSPGLTGTGGLVWAILTHTVAGPSAVTATLTTANGPQSLTVTLEFVADADTAHIAEGDFVLIRDGAVANNVETNEVRARVTDANGNPVEGRRVVFSSQNGATITTSNISLVDGWVVATLKHTQAGQSGILVQMAGVPGGITRFLFPHFVADPSTATLKLFPFGSEVVADGVAQRQVLGQVVDANQNPIADQRVTFSATNQPILNVSEAVSNAEGGLLLLVANTHAGTTTVTGTLTSNNATSVANLEFIANSQTAQLATLTVIDNDAQANGIAQNQVRARVVDGLGNSLANVAVTFTATQGAQLAQVTVQTDVNGEAVNTLTSTLAGDSVVTAKLGAEAGITATTRFIAGPVAQLELVTTVNDAVADNNDTNAVQATIKDANGNPVSGSNVDFIATNGATVIAANGGVSDDHGMVLATLTNASAGDSIVTANIGALNKTTDTKFIAGAVANIELSVLDDDAVANGSDTNVVQAIVTDARGNLVSGQTVVFRSDNTDVQMTPVIGTTGADGVATATLTTTVAGTNTVVATIGSVSDSIDTTFVAGAVANIVVNIINDNARADGIDTNTVEAIVTDSYGNSVANQLIRLNPNGGVNVSPGIVITDADGRVRASFTHTIAGPVTVTTTSNGQLVFTNITFIADAATADFALTVVQNNQLANGSSTNLVLAKIVDGNGNPLANQQIDFTLSSNSAVTTGSRNISDAQGTAYVAFHNTAAGVTTVTATLGLTGQTKALDTHFVAGKAESIELTMTQDGALANGIDTNEIQVLVVDGQGNPINGAEVSLTSLSGMSITPSKVTTNANGTATATLTHTLAGILPINARIDQVSKTINATFIADAATAQIAEGDLTILNNNGVADGEAVNAVIAKVTDGYGNPLEGQRVTFVLSNNGTIQFKLDVTSDEGGALVTFSNTQAGITNVTATVESSGSSRDIDTTFIADITTAHIAEGDLVVITDNAVANNLDKNEVHARVTDAKGNVLPGQTVIFTSGNGAAITTVNSLSDENGLTSATLTHTVAGTSVVTATVSNRAQSKDTTFVADSTTATIRASDLTITRNNALANGIASNEARVIVTDANGNPVPNMFVGYTSDNGAVMTPPSGATDSNGMFSTTLTQTIAGTSNVTASIVTMGIRQSKPAVFIADVSTARVSALTVVKNDSIANNSDRNIVRAYIQDAYGNVITGMNVNFSATENVTLTANMVTTNDQGYAANTLRHDTSVTSAVTATVANDLVGLTENVRFVAGAGARIEMFRIEDGAVADGIQTNRVEAKVYDADDNPVPNTQVTFTTASGQLVLADTQTNASGSAYATISNIKAGQDSVSVTADNVSASTYTTFIADKDNITLTDERFIIINDNALANGIEQNRVLLSVVDANGNEVAGIPVSFSSANGASITAATTTDIYGVAIATLTHTTSGPSEVTATLQMPSGGTASLTVTPQFIADQETADIATGDFIIVDDGAVANNVAYNEVRARVTDSRGNPVAGYSVVFSSQNGATITTPGITGDDGWVSAKLTHIKAGDSGILARVTRPLAVVHTLTPYFIADVNTAKITLSPFKLSPQDTIADGVDKYPVIAMVTDDNQNPIAGQQVTFIATNGAILSEDNGSVSNAQGSVLLYVATTHAGITTVTGTLASNNATSSTDLLFIANKNTAQLSTLMAVDNNALANGIARNQVRARVVDDLGNPVADVAVTFTANHGAQLSQVTVHTDNNGNAVTSLTNSLAGVTVVTAKLGTTGTALSVNTVFVAGPLAALTLVTTVNNAFADNSDNNTVRATLSDATGNPIVGEVVAFTATNGATITATDGGVSNANGIVFATLTSATAGVSPVTATIATFSAKTDTTFIAMRNLDVTVNGQTFAGDAGFPTTGFVGATFRVNSGGDNSLYDWSSSAPSLVSVGSDGMVKFNAVFPTGTPAITISATPKGGGSPLSYSFRVNQWFTNGGSRTLSRADGAEYCENTGYVMPASGQVTNAATWASGTRAIGNLWSEWGNFSAYSDVSWRPAGQFWLSDDYSPGTQHTAELSAGGLSTINDTASMLNLLCTRPQ